MLCKYKIKSKSFKCNLIEITYLYNYFSGDFFAHKLIYFLNTSKLISAHNCEQWKPAYRYNFELTACPLFLKAKHLFSIVVFHQFLSISEKILKNWFWNKLEGDLNTFLIYLI